MRRATEVWRRYAQAAGLLLLVWAAGAAAEALGVPVPWLLGPLAVAVFLRLVLNLQTRLPASLVLVAQVTTGVNIGLASRVDAFHSLGGVGWALALVVLVPLVISMLGGFVLARWADVDPASGFLGSIPGAAAGVVAMSTDLGADAATVATLQYLRVLTIAAVMPLLAAHLPGGSGAMTVVATAAGGAVPAPGLGPAVLASGAAVLGAGAPLVVLLGQYLILAAGAAVAVRLARRVGMPSPAFLAPLALALALGATAFHGFRLPPPAASLALGAIGFNVGTGIDLPTLRRLRRAALVNMAVVVSLLLASVMTGYFFHRVSGVDLSTALLGSVPGAMEAVTAAAYSLGADGALVAAMHLVRFLIAALAGPWIAGRLIRRYARRAADQEAAHTTR